MEQHVLNNSQHYYIPHMVSPYVRLTLQLIIWISHDGKLNQLGTGNSLCHLIEELGPILPSVIFGKPLPLTSLCQLFCFIWAHGHCKSLLKTHE